MDDLKTISAISIIPLSGTSSIQQGDDLAELISQVLSIYFPLTENDCIVIDSKLISISRGRIEKITNENTMDQVIERESKQILRRTNSHVISQTPHGFICENAGVVKLDDDTAILLPKDSDSAAHGIRKAIQAESGFDVAVIICGTFGRSFRMGNATFALGYSGLKSFPDLQDKEVSFGEATHPTTTAIADEIANASSLVLDGASGANVALFRGLSSSYRGSGSGTDLVRNLKEELFR